MHRCPFLLYPSLPQQASAIFISPFVYAWRRSALAAQHAQQCSGSSAGVAGGGGFGCALFGGLGGFCSGLCLFGGSLFCRGGLCGGHRVGGRCGVRRLYRVGGTFRVPRRLGISRAIRISGRLRLAGPGHGEGHRLQALVVAQGAGTKRKPASSSWRRCKRP